MGAANIARKNWQAIRNSGNGTVVAVASRDLARAKQFLNECQQDAPMEGPGSAYGSYDALLRDPNIDAVYIPLPTGIRKGWVMRAAEAGKHVLCEKPCARSVAELTEMIRDTDRMWLNISAGREFDARLYRTEDEDETSSETPPLVRIWRKEA